MKKINKKLLLNFLIFFILLYAIFLISFTKNTEIKIISFNDFHGSIENEKRVGAEKFFGFIESNSDQNTIIVSVGDNFQGEVLSNEFYGLPIIDFFKKINLTFSAIGNHEFDWGIDKIYKEWKDIKFISANIEKNDKLLVEPYFIKEINGIKIGFIGLSTEEILTKVNKKMLNDIQIQNPVETARKYVKILKNKGIKNIVLVCHIGTYLDKDGKLQFENEELNELTKIDGIKLIITGHSHKNLISKLNNVFIIQSGSNGDFLGITKINFRNKKIKKIEIQNINLLENKDKLNNNKIMKKIIDKYKDELNTKNYNDVIFTLNKDLIHSRDKLSDLGIFICENLSKIANSKIVILNSGSIRNSLYKGKITRKNIYEILPFKNDLVEIKISGENLIKNILENQNKIQYYGFYIKNNKIFLNNNEEILKDNFYNIVINDFMLNSGDSFNFKNATIIKNYGLITDLLINNPSLDF